MAGCRCLACFDGKPHTPPDEHAIERVLTRAGYPKPTRPIPLRLVQLADERTMLTAAPVCDGSMTCDCADCQQATLARVKRGGEGGGPSDPFRRAAA